jgi:hypothetical protein
LVFLHVDAKGQSYQNFAILEISRELNRCRRGVVSSTSPTASKQRPSNSSRHDPERWLCHHGATVSRRSRESNRVLQVRNRCKAQNLALSTWWKVALQSNIQQRMWMRLGNNQVEPELPPQFERIYQPEKLSQIDRFFSRTRSAPVRRSHAAQHSEGLEDGDATEFSRVISGNFASASPDNGPVEHIDEGLAVSAFIKKWRFGSRSDPSLKLFAKHYKKSPVSSDFFYIGNPDTTNRPPNKSIHRMSLHRARPTVLQIPTECQQSKNSKIVVTIIPWNQTM